MKLLCVDRNHGIFRLTNPGGMSVIRQCQQRGFHSHDTPPDGGPIYKTCTDVYMNPNLDFDVIDLRWSSFPTTLIHHNSVFIYDIQVCAIIGLFTAPTMSEHLCPHKKRKQKQNWKELGVIVIVWTDKQSSKLVLLDDNTWHSLSQKILFLPCFPHFDILILKW